MLNSKKEELSYKSQKLQQLYETGDRAQMQNYMNDNRMWIPMMLFSGLINMVMFASMMSFMGMAMNPAESAQTEGHTDDAGVSADTTGDTTTSASSDTGSTDTGGVDGYSDADFGGGAGMDTGGFDSF